MPISVSGDNAMFTEAAAETVAAELTASKDALTPEQPPATIPDGEPGTPTNELADVAEAVEADDEFSELDALETPTTEEPPASDAPAEEPNEVEFQQFNEQFKKHTGLDLKEAITSFEQTQQSAVQAANELKQAYAQLQLMQQKLDLQSQWSVDPEVQQQVQSGVPLSTVVEQRIQVLQSIYNKLSPERQKKVDTLGARGVTELWKIYSKKNNRTLPGSPVGVTPAAAQAGKMKLSEIMAMSESDYKTKGLQLLKSGDFIND